MFSVAVRFNIFVSIFVSIFSSKDTLIKLWDLDTQHCFLTLVGHRSEVSLDMKFFSCSNHIKILSIAKSFLTLH